MAKTTFCIPSSRVYFDEMDAGQAQRLQETVQLFNRAKEKLYNLQYDSKFLGKETGNLTKELKDWLRETYHCCPPEYYISSLMTLANGMVRSQAELQKLYRKEFEEQCDARKRKLKVLRRRLTLCQKSKESLRQYSRCVKQQTKTSPLYIPKDFARKLPVEERRDAQAVYRYELWLDKERRRLKARIAQIMEKDRAARARREKNGSIPPRITFGTKKQYRLKDTAGMARTLWQEQRTFARNRTVLFSGRYDARYKNWLVKYDMDRQEMRITLMDRSELLLRGISFPYRADDLKEALSHKKEPGVSIGYWLEIRKDHNGRMYLLLKAAITKKYTQLNEYALNGVVSVDLNLDNISWSELNAQGIRIRGGSIWFSISGKTSHQIDDILGRACSRIIATCRESGKPLAMEDLDLQKKKAGMAYGKRRANAAASLFAYAKMEAFLKGKSYRNGTGVFCVHPAYTSQIGKMKYMRQMKGTVHQAASYVIGRRSMGFPEKVPAIYKNLIPEAKKRSHHWKQFAHICALTKELSPEMFRKRLPEFTDRKQLKAYAKHA